MIKVLQINTVYKNGGSTGRIVYDLKSIGEKNNIMMYVAYGYEYSKLLEEDYIKTRKLEGILELKWNILKTRLFAHHGFYNLRATRRLIRYMDEIKPDIIHLHNIHNHYVNIAMLFDYIKKHNIPVVWTLHDCWSFTGWCAYFDLAKCDKWKSGCKGECRCLHDYPFTWFFNRSQQNFLDKKRTFCGVKDLTLITPSQWLADLTRESFLNNYPVEVINNGVDTDIFKPKRDNDIRSKYGVPQTTKVILALMSGFNKRKGAEYLLKLPDLLSDNECLVIVGISNRQKKMLPQKHCIGITRTDNVNDLASIYSTADVFINPTLEDNFPTTNIESLACGTPVITFRTGGSIESVDDTTGLIVSQGNLNELLISIRSVISKGKGEYKDACIEKANVQYNKAKQYQKYIELYHQIKDRNK